MADKWMSCSACRVEIAFGAKHYVCSVSTCNRSRTRLVFCSVSCWDTHLSVLRHRDAGAVEAFAPTRQGWEAEQRAEEGLSTPSTWRVVTPTPARGESGDDALIVISKMKKYIRDRSGMNTSDAVAAALSDHVRALCDVAIRTAGAEGRKTVLDRDVPMVGRNSAAP